MYVLDVVLRREELVEVVDGSQQLLTQNSLTFAMLSFLMRREGGVCATEVVCCVCEESPTFTRLRQTIGEPNRFRQAMKWRAAGDANGVARSTR